DFQLISLLRRGHSNKEIAAQLSLTEGTVKTYLHRLFETLGVHSRTDLLALAEAVREGCECGMISRFASCPGEAAMPCDQHRHTLALIAGQLRGGEAESSRQHAETCFECGRLVRDGSAEAAGDSIATAGLDP